MASLKLTLEQRSLLRNILQSQQGTRADTLMFQKIISKLEAKDEEMEAIDGQKIPVGAEGEDFVWTFKRDKDVEKEIEFSTGELLRLEKVIKEYPSFTVADERWLKPIADQIGV